MTINGVGGRRELGLGSFGACDIGGDGGGVEEVSLGWEDERGGWRELWRKVVGFGELRRTAI